MQEKITICAGYLHRPIGAVLSDDPGVSDHGGAVLVIDGKKFDFKSAYLYGWKICGGGRLAGSWRRRFREMEK